MEDQFGATSMEQYFDALESADPGIESLGITDYLLTRRYEEVLAAKNNDRLTNVDLLFCNIEIRLGMETKAGKPVNMHLLVSPEDPEHIEQINRFLSKLTFTFAKDTYCCTPDDLRRLGYAHDSSIQDDEVALRAGVNQFKVNFEQLRTLYDRTEWAQNSVLIAVAGSSNDGTAGLQDETASFAAIRKEIEAFAHIIFTATPKNIEFWRGEGVLSVEELEKKYGGPKPCLHGSDAHSLAKVAQPDNDRRCWIKGSATFEALRQACLEPRSRVHIGPTPPEIQTPYSIVSVATPTLPWLTKQPQLINEGMVAIIGARGSGKTALADLIAHAGNSPHPIEGEQSFLTRAKSFLGSATVTGDWSDGTRSDHSLNQAPTDYAEVHYLTQQFVDRLCSSVAESDELLDEIKRVVFLAHPPESRLGADSFDALVRLRSSETQLAVQSLNQRLDQLSQDLLIERNWYLRRAGIKKDLQKIKEELSKIDGARKQLIKPGGKERSEYYTRLINVISTRETTIQALTRKRQAYVKLQHEAERYKAQVFPQVLSDLQRAHGDGLLSTDEWAKLLPAFADDPTTMLAAKRDEQTALIKTATEQTGATPTKAMTIGQLGACSLESLRDEQKKIGEQIGADQKNAQRLQQLARLHATHEARRTQLEEDQARAEQSPARLDGILAERANLYERFFELITEQCDILADLYAPLGAKLEGASNSAARLRLKVVRSVDVEKWARDIEGLLDLRKNGEFRGRGALAEIAAEALLPAWQTGTAAEAAAAMEAFRASYNQALLDQSSVDREADEYQQWVVDLARYQYSTDHIRVHYSIEYDGVSITQLSPGTRGIVMLLLYLALDVEDARPLIIDQPEENLDPQSVYTELVALFRDARLRRQVIIVTHNANLVVNADVDQVIVASCTKHGGGTPPEFSYVSGGLEDKVIRDHVCKILEGGETAFKERARRLRVSLSR
ncbi:AAA family ATPase [Mycobacterium marinum]|uniref:TrlF family AAA-like ATPase n=1 Tax=Mycobacterium marinum TaxID=1781 RepID=UPI002359E3E8|nr:AAA family ATPase [Mycobacterium marinum]WCS17758.1 AAA family ATPase [Mycobacterium marinum]